MRGWAGEDAGRVSLAPEHRRGHGALYDAVNHGRKLQQLPSSQFKGMPESSKRGGVQVLQVVRPRLG